MLCGELNRSGDACIHVTDSTDSICCPTETNNIVKQLYSSKNYFKKETIHTNVPSRARDICLIHITTQWTCFTHDRHFFPHSMLAFNWTPALTVHIHVPELFIVLCIYLYYLLSMQGPSQHLYIFISQAETLTKFQQQPLP